MNQNEENNQLENINQQPTITPNDNKQKIILIIVISIVLVIIVVALTLGLLMNKNSESNPNSRRNNNGNSGIYEGEETFNITVGYVENEKNIKVLRTKLPDVFYTYLFMTGSGSTCIIQENGNCIINGDEPDNVKDLIKSEKVYPSTIVTRNIEIEVVPTSERTLKDYKKQYPGGVEINDKTYSVITKFRYDNDRVFFYQPNPNYLVFIVNNSTRLSAKDYGEEMLKIVEEV